MKIYTRTGDKGDTGMCGPERIKKDSLRMEVCGTLDELNAVFGVSIAAGLGDRIMPVIERIQAELFEIGAEVASIDPVAFGTRRIGDKNVAALEADIDCFTAGLAELHEFILPGGSMAAAQLHVARTVCRRAERRLVTLMEEEKTDISPKLLVYLNRLSDLLFVLARAENAQSGQSDRLRPN
ncbi:MAG: cob(I)yrinic acid a,c-diamide adenosyltransferase [Pirellulales bacterium]|nr:cob(I)yrinic acid a,c-diamide adenosyltransferase [Pirellulales bacterium]